MPANDFTTDKIRAQLEPLAKGAEGGMGVACGGMLVKEWVKCVQDAALRLGITVATVGPARRYSDAMEFVGAHREALLKSSGPCVVIVDTSDHAATPWVRAPEVSAALANIFAVHPRSVYLHVAPAGSGQLYIKYQRPAP